MMKLAVVARVAVAAGLVPLMMVQPSFGWGADGHSMINRLAAANLPTDVPAFLRSGAGAGCDELSGAGAGPVAEQGRE